MTGPTTPGHEGAEDAVELFTEWLRSDGFTCLGARAALHRGELVTGVYPALGSAECLPELASDLGRFITGSLSTDGRFHSFAAIFTECDPPDPDEETFEQLLWRQLRALHEADRTDNVWAHDVSDDPRSPDFGFSFGGHPFFVIGLHPGASRVSRRFARPALVFNSHRQFAELKRAGVYQGMQTKIRAKERELQGDVNPMLAEHGVISEARQYSGRIVPPDWECPFSRPG
ncbi:guanitoxin biosynthesis heme-dependent pre-guanitoxin N-hydroxylase GntA [Streptomyces sp. NPDC001435]|uniref:guanitoxin biosynthesis heme-dependent pre-guanitoxin N-hydroxylase GntA n=1 Tax=unclassified Streptomyces TaxID=2593676 RepID=UPI0036A91951